MINKKEERMIARQRKRRVLKDKIKGLKKINADDVTKPEVVRKNKVWIEVYEKQLDEL